MKALETIEKEKRGFRELAYLITWFQAALAHSPVPVHYLNSFLHLHMHLFLLCYSFLLDTVAKKRKMRKGAFSHFLIDTHS